MREPAVMRAAAERGGPEFEPFLTAREVADRLRIAPCTVLRYFDDGVLPGRRLRVGRGRPVRFRWSEIEAALLEAQR
jgi:predicted site-specific integrase-resolvase